jgi:hypothetical protein
MSRLNINKCHRVRRREIQTLHCSIGFTFSNAYSAQDFSSYFCRIKTQRNKEKITKQLNTTVINEMTG